MERYRKFLVALAAALAVLGTGLADEGLSGTEIIASLLAGLGALGVWAVPNKPEPPLNRLTFRETTAPTTTPEVT